MILQKLSKTNDSPTLPFFGSWIRCRSRFDFKDGCACTIGRAVPCKPPDALSVKQEQIDPLGTDDARNKTIRSKWFLRLSYWRTERVEEKELIFPGWVRREDNGCERQQPQGYGRQSEEFWQHVRFSSTGRYGHLIRKFVSKGCEVMVSPACRIIPRNPLFFSFGLQSLA